MKSNYIVLGVAFLVLLASFALQVYERTVHPPIYTKGVLFEDVFIQDAPGWEGEDTELASTERLQEISEDVLNFNDHLYRTYRKGSKMFSIYAAYWEPLQMPVRQVGSHTPDVCWVRAGWEMHNPKDKVVLKDQQGRKLKPALYREYTVNGDNRQYVYFWHLVGNEVFFSDNKPGQWDRTQIITDFFKFGMNQKREQYFVRLQTDKPFEQIWEDPGFQAVFESLAETVPLLEGVEPAAVEIDRIRELKDRIREENEAEEAEEDHY